MESKDTVLQESKDILFNEDWDEGGGFMNEPVQEALLKQAEISFKAGYDEALNTVVATREYDEGKEAGIKEVVDWIHAHSKGDRIERITKFIPISVLDWEAKLKEWGRTI